MGIHIRIATTVSVNGPITERNSHAVGGVKNSGNDFVNRDRNRSTVLRGKTASSITIPHAWVTLFASKRKTPQGNGSLLPITAVLLRASQLLIGSSMAP